MSINYTFQEWKDSLRVPMPHKSKKHYTRKEKHKGKNREWWRTPEGVEEARDIVSQYDMIFKNAKRIADEGKLLSPDLMGKTPGWWRTLEGVKAALNAAKQYHQQHLSAGAE